MATGSYFALWEVRDPRFLEGGDPRLGRMRAPFLGEDAPSLLPGGKAISVDGPPHATRRRPLPPGPGSGLRAPVCGLRRAGADLRLLRSALRVRRVSAPLPPATRRVSWLRRAALANQRCRSRPSLAPQPISAPATGHRPRGEEEGKAGAESGLRGRGRGGRGPGGGTPRAGSQGWDCGGG